MATARSISVSMRAEPSGGRDVVEVRRLTLVSLRLLCGGRFGGRGAPRAASALLGEVRVGVVVAQSRAVPVALRAD